LSTFATGHRITKNHRLTRLSKMQGGVGDLPEWVGFGPPSLHVKSCPASYRETD